MMADWGANMQVRMIERAPGNTSGEFGITDLENLKFAAHNLSTGRSFHESALCGSDKWLDNHRGIAIFGAPKTNGTLTYNTILDSLEEKQ